MSQIDEIQKSLERVETRQEQILSALVGHADSPGLIETVRDHGDQLHLLTSQIGDVIDLIRSRGVVI